MQQNVTPISAQQENQKYGTWSCTQGKLTKISKHETNKFLLLATFTFSNGNRDCGQQLFTLLY